MVQVDIRKDGSENVHYDYNGYSAYVHKGLLSSYPGFAADSHWHDDLEWISVLSGDMNYNVNGEVFHLEAGQGIWVNAKQLHYGFSPAHRECIFTCVVLHPMLLCASQQINRDFIMPIITDESLPYILLDSQIHWQQQILDFIQCIYDIRESLYAPLHIQSLFYRIWVLMSEHATAVRKKAGASDRRLSILKDMLSFIQENYRSRITLAMIAAAGNVSSSTCLVLFKKYLQDTPANYVTKYRIKKAMDLLIKSDLSITEIAFDVGFRGASYFAEAFCKNCGCSPSEYREKYAAPLRSDFITIL